MAKGLAVYSGSTCVHKIREDGVVDFNGSVGITGSLTSSNILLNTIGNIEEPSISFLGSGSTDPINLKVISGSSLSFEGTAGQLISITNNLTSGIIFSVNDVTGIPLLEADASGTVSIARFGTNLGVGTNTPTAKLDVNGNTAISGALNISGNIAPNGDGVYEIGTSTNRFADVYAVQTTVGAVFETGLTTKGIEQYPTGTVLVWKNGKLKACDKSEDNMVMGVGKYGKQQPIILGAEPVLVTGKVEEGDWIVTSDKIGHGKALRKKWWKRNMVGKIIAQALESCDGKSNLIKCMIHRF